MTNSNGYKSRKHQYAAFTREYKAGKMSLQNLVRSVAVCSAAEERHRTLQIVTGGKFQNEICSVSVLNVLGYD